MLFLPLPPPETAYINFYPVKTVVASLLVRKLVEEEDGDHWGCVWGDVSDAAELENLGEEEVLQSAGELPVRR